MTDSTNIVNDSTPDQTTPDAPSKPQQPAPDAPSKPAPLVIRPTHEQFPLHELIAFLNVVEIGLKRFFDATYDDDAGEDVIQHIHDAVTASETVSANEFIRHLRGELTFPSADICLDLVRDALAKQPAPPVGSAGGATVTKGRADSVPDNWVDLTTGAITPAHPIHALSRLIDGVNRVFARYRDVCEMAGDVDRRRYIDRVENHLDRAREEMIDFQNEWTAHWPEKVVRLPDADPLIDEFLQQYNEPQPVKAA